MLVVDVHGHLTLPPKSLETFRNHQLAALKDPSYQWDRVQPEFSAQEATECTTEIRKLQKERDTDFGIVSPRASVQEHYVGGPDVGKEWAIACNNLVHRVVQTFPETFAGVCQLPQSPGISMDNSIEELERCVTELGFIGCNLTPDPSGGFWTSKPLSDPYWHPFFEAMVRLDVPAMIHVSGSCNPAFQPPTGSHYINADTTGFEQLANSDLFDKYPTLKFIIAHGGGAAPYQMDRFRGIAQEKKLPRTPMDAIENGNIFFDTCMYGDNGMRFLIATMPAKSILFASEMIGACRGVDPKTGRRYDDTKKYIDVLPLTEADIYAIFEGNARRAYPRLGPILDKRAQPA